MHAGHLAMLGVVLMGLVPLIYVRVRYRDQF